MIATEETLDVARTGWYLFAAAALIFLNGFYVAYEFAVLAARRATFESARYRTTAVGRAARGAMSDLSMQLAGAQLGITMASLALGYVGEPAFEQLIEAAIGTSLGEEVTHAIAIAVSLTVVVFLHLVVGEMVPKNFALAAPDATLRWLVLPYRAYLLVFRPFVLALNGLANGALRLFGVEPRNELMAVHSVSELQAIVSHSSQEGSIEADDAQLLHGALEFARRPVGEVATPLEGWATLRLGATAAQAERVVASSGQERIPISRNEDRTAFIGYVHARDLLGLPPERRGEPLPTDLVRRMAIVRSDRALIEVLRTLRRVGRQMALVVDGGSDSVAMISVEQVSQALLTDTVDGPH